MKFLPKGGNCCCACCGCCIIIGGIVSNATPKFSLSIANGSDFDGPKSPTTSMTSSTGLVLSFLTYLLVANYKELE